MHSLAWATLEAYTDWHQEKMSDCIVPWNIERDNGRKPRALTLREFNKTRYENAFDLTKADGFAMELFKKWLYEDERDIPDEFPDRLERLNAQIDPERFADPDLLEYVDSQRREIARQYLLDRPDARASQREEEARFAAHHAMGEPTYIFGRKFADSKLLLDAEIPDAAPDSSRVKRGVLRSETAAEFMGL